MGAETAGFIARGGFRIAARGGMAGEIGFDSDTRPEAAALGGRAGGTNAGGAMEVAALRARSRRGRIREEASE